MDRALRSGLVAPKVTPMNPQSSPEPHAPYTTEIAMTEAVSISQPEERMAARSRAVVRGCFRILVLYDVAEAIRLETLRSLVPVPARRVPGLTHQTPEYARFERPPVLHLIEPIVLGNGKRMDALMKYYDYGVVALDLEHRFACDWKLLVEQCSEWVAPIEIQDEMRDVVRRYLEKMQAALVKPYDQWLSEGYFVVQLEEADSSDGRRVAAAQLLTEHGADIAQLVRGESAALSKTEQQEVLQSSMSYYASDLVVLGWKGAFVYDQPESAGGTVQILESANAQLLEFRYYDNLLTRVLERVYAALEHARGFISGWRLSRQAQRLKTIRLDVMELTERTDNAIKFLSDTFYARLYRLAEAKVGVSDYRELVDEKLGTAGELYEFMVEQFNQTRGFILELAILLILIIDLILLFRGKS